VLLYISTGSTKVSGGGEGRKELGELQVNQDAAEERYSLKGILIREGKSCRTLIKRALRASGK